MAWSGVAIAVQFRSCTAVEPEDGRPRRGTLWRTNFCHRAGPAWLRNYAGAYLRSDAHSELHALYCRPDHFLFVVHPDVLAMPELYMRSVLDSSARGPLVEVAPSANARTVFVRSIDGAAVTSHFL